MMVRFSITMIKLDRCNFNQVITATDISNGYLRLNPDANDTGSPYTTFEFSVNDGDADSSSSYTMTVNVTNTNDAPVGVNDTTCL